jgi:hypothetical protein
MGELLTLLLLAWDVLGAVARLLAPDHDHTY